MSTKKNKPYGRGGKTRNIISPRNYGKNTQPKMINKLLKWCQIRHHFSILFYSFIFPISNCSSSANLARVSVEEVISSIDAICSWEAAKEP